MLYNNYVSNVAYLPTNLRVPYVSEPGGDIPIHAWKLNTTPTAYLHNYTRDGKYIVSSVLGERLKVGGAGNEILYPIYRWCNGYMQWNKYYLGVVEYFINGVFSSRSTHWIYQPSMNVPDPENARQYYGVVENAITPAGGGVTTYEGDTFYVGNIGTNLTAGGMIKGQPTVSLNWHNYIYKRTQDLNGDVGGEYINQENSQYKITIGLPFYNGTIKDNNVYNLVVVRSLSTVDGFYTYNNLSSNNVVISRQTILVNDEKKPYWVLGQYNSSNWWISEDEPNINHPVVFMFMNGVERGDEIYDIDVEFNSYTQGNNTTQSFGFNVGKFNQE